MKTKPIHLTDWSRILVGDVPLSFFAELFIRAVFVYVILLVCMRLMGKRMAAQLSRTEMVGLVALAAMIGIPLQSPERGLLPAIVIAVVIVVIQQILASRASHDTESESLIQGSVNTLVEEGVMKMEEMKKTRITRERLFAQLRSAGLTHLGRVKRVYFEANGSFTTIVNTQPSPGLSILPEVDPDFIREQPVAHGVWVCALCGQHDGHKGDPCPNCRDRRRVEAFA